MQYMCWPLMHMTVFIVLWIKRCLCGYGEELGPEMRDYVRGNAQQIMTNGEVIHGKHVQTRETDKNCLDFFPKGLTNLPNSGRMGFIG